MTKGFLLFIGVFLSYVVGFGQANQDYLLTMNKDTLYGTIKFNPKSNTIVFYWNEARAKFHASTIEYFGMYKRGRLRNYKTITNDWDNEVFVEVLTEGKLNLYLYDTSGNEHYESGDSYRYYLGQNKEQLIRVSPKSYKNILAKMLKNQPHLLAQRIDYRDLPKIIKEYNNFSTIEASR